MFRSVMTRGLVALGLAPVLLIGCASGSATPQPHPPATASAPVPVPVPGVTLPPDALATLVPRPDEVPAGMVPVIAGSGPRNLKTVAGYSGTGATATAAAAKLRAHGFVKAYVAQYANPSTGQVMSIVVSTFATAVGATADFGDDQAGARGKRAVTPTLGAASSVTVQDLPGSVVSQLVLVRFRRGTTTWSLAYKAGPVADPQLAIGVATALLRRT
ncbi:MAG: hypothetical protein JWM02_887 [Frankiales bacterium]|nr:hypothetical protein [Frankiales bacterium]